MVDTITKPPSNWQPEQDKVRLAVLGKLMEELSECCSAAARCMIQGIDEKEPETGKLNRLWLEQELADVRALVTLTIEEFQLNTITISTRALMKIEHKRAWLAMLKNGS